MTYNEIQYLLIGLVGGIFVSWLYLKIVLRRLPYKNKSLNNLMKKNKEQRQYIEKRIDDLEEEKKEVFREYDDPDKSWH